MLLIGLVAATPFAASGCEAFDVNGDGEESLSEWYCNLVYIINRSECGDLSLIP